MNLYEAAMEAVVDAPQARVHLRGRSASWRGGRLRWEDTGEDVEVSGANLDGWQLVEPEPETPGHEEWRVLRSKGIHPYLDYVRPNPRSQVRLSFAHTEAGFAGYVYELPDGTRKAGVDLPGLWWDKEIGLLVNWPKLDHAGQPLPKYQRLRPVAVLIEKVPESSAKE